MIAMMKNKIFYTAMISIIMVLTSMTSEAASSTAVRKTLVVNGLKMSYLQWGSDSAPPMLMIPGANSVSSVWMPVAQAFGSEYRVVSFDMPGQGYSEWDPSKRYNVTGHVASVREAIRSLGLKKLVVVGHSMGGHEAVVLTAEEGSNVVALVAMGGGYMVARPAPPSAPVAPAAANNASPDAAVVEFASWEEAKAKLIGPLTPEERQAQAENRYKQADNGKIISRNDPGLRSRADPEGMMLPDATAPFARRILVPSMVLRGSEDKAFQKDNAEALTALLPNVKLYVTVPGAGHGVHQEKPAEVIAALRGFLTLVKPAQ